MPLAVILGQALINFLIATTITVVIAGVTYILHSAVVNDLNRQRQFRHFRAMIIVGNLGIGNGLTPAQAGTRTSQGHDVWSVSRADARLVAGGASAIGPENGVRNGWWFNTYFSHFHRFNRNGSHSFFGNGTQGQRLW